jgi:hypothetical protein
MVRIRLTTLMAQIRQPGPGGLRSAWGQGALALLCGVLSVLTICEPVTALPNLVRNLLANPETPVSSQEDEEGEGSAAKHLAPLQRRTRRQTFTGKLASGRLPLGQLTGTGAPSLRFSQSPLLGRGRGLPPGAVFPLRC